MLGQPAEGCRKFDRRAIEQGRRSRTRTYFDPVGLPRANRETEARRVRSTAARAFARPLALGLRSTCRVSTLAVGSLGPERRSDEQGARNARRRRRYLGRSPAHGGACARGGGGPLGRHEGSARFRERQGDLRSSGSPPATPRQAPPEIIYFYEAMRRLGDARTTTPASVDEVVAHALLFVFEVRHAPFGLPARRRAEHAHHPERRAAPTPKNGSDSSGRREPGRRGSGPLSFQAASSGPLRRGRFVRALRRAARSGPIHLGEVPPGFDTGNGVLQTLATTWQRHRKFAPIDTNAIPVRAGRPAFEGPLRNRERAYRRASHWRAAGRIAARAAEGRPRKIVGPRERPARAVASKRLQARPRVASPPGKAPEPRPARDAQRSKQSSGARRGGAPGRGPPSASPAARAAATLRAPSGATRLDEASRPAPRPPDHSTPRHSAGEPGRPCRAARVRRPRQARRGA